MKIKEISDINKFLTEISNTDSNTKELDKEELVILNIKDYTKDVALDNISKLIQKINNPIAIFSSKISKEEIINKILSDKSKIKYNKIENGQINSEEWDRLTKIIETLSKKEIYIDDTLESSIQEIIVKIRDLKEKKNIRMIIIDYSKVEGI